MGSSRKKKSKTKYSEHDGLKNKVPTHEQHCNKPSSMQQVLRCLRNQCNVEVENIDYVLNGRKSISLTELPEWYHADETYGFPCLPQIDCNKKTIDADNDDHENHDLFDIKIVDTFSLAKSPNAEDVSDKPTTSNQNTSNSIDSSIECFTRKADNLVMNEGTQFQEIQLGTVVGYLPSVKVERPEVDHSVTAFQSPSAVSSEEVKSIFHSPTLDSLLAIEAKKLEKNLDSLLERLNASSKNILYNTPCSQANYVKTLQTALMERNKISVKSEKKDAISKPFCSLRADSEARTSREVIGPLDSSLAKTNFCRRNMVPATESTSTSNPRKFRNFHIKMLQHMSRKFVEDALTAIPADSVKHYSSQSLDVPDIDMLQNNTPSEFHRGTADAIKKRLSRVSTFGSNNFDHVTDYFETSGDTFISNAKTKDLTVYQGKILPSLFQYKHVALNKKAEKLKMQKLSDPMANVAVAALNLAAGWTDDYKNRNKLSFLRYYPFRNVKVLKRLRHKVKCLKPISLTQAVSKYLLYNGRKWKSEKLRREYSLFCFNDLPVTLTKLKDQPSHLKLRLAKQKLRWEEFPTARGMMIFPESYSAADDTILHSTTESCADNVSFQTLKSLTCARALPIFRNLIPKKHAQKKKAPLRNLLPPAASSSSFTMDESMSFENMLGSVMVVQLSHAKRKNSSMVVKIMSFCEWDEKAEEILNIIVENHYELQNMQRGRYIRTMMDGYLIEVLRANSSQVIHKNMPATVQKEILQSPSQDISLVKVSSNDSNPTANLDAKRLINFSEAIDDMLRLDKRLASARQGIRAPKAKLLTLKQTKQDLENDKNKKKKTPQNKKVSKVDASSSQSSNPVSQTAVTVTTTCTTTTPSNTTLNDIETALKNLVERQRTTPTTVNTPVTTFPPITTTCSSTEIYPVSTLAHCSKDTYKLSYEVGKMGCLNNKSQPLKVGKNGMLVKQAFNFPSSGFSIDLMTSANTQKEHFTISQAATNLACEKLLSPSVSASASENTPPFEYSLDVQNHISSTCSVASSVINVKDATSKLAEIEKDLVQKADNLKPVDMLFQQVPPTNVATSTSAVTENNSEASIPANDTSPLLSKSGVGPSLSNRKTSKKTTVTLTNATTHIDLTDLMRKSNSATSGKYKINSSTSRLSPLQTYIAIPIRLVAQSKSASNTAPPGNTFTVPYAAHKDGVRTTQLQFQPTLCSVDSADRSLQPKVAKVGPPISFNLDSNVAKRAAGSGSVKLVSSLKTSPVVSSTVSTNIQPVLCLPASKPTQDNQTPLPSKTTYTLPVVLKKQTVSRLLKIKNCNSAATSDSGKLKSVQKLVQGAPLRLKNGRLILASKMSNSSTSSRIKLLHTLASNTCKSYGTLQSSHLKGIHGSVHLGSSTAAALRKVNARSKLAKKKLKCISKIVAPTVLPSVKTAVGLSPNETKPLKRSFDSALGYINSISGSSSHAKKMKKDQELTEKCVVISREECNLLKKVCADTRLIRLCNRWNLKAHDVMKVIRNLCKKDASEITEPGSSLSSQREDRLWQTFSKAMSYQSKVADLLSGTIKVEEKKTNHVNSAKHNSSENTSTTNAISHKLMADVSSFKLQTGVEKISESQDIDKQIAPAVSKKTRINPLIANIMPSLSELDIACDEEIEDSADEIDVGDEELCSSSEVQQPSMETSEFVKNLRRCQDSQQNDDVDFSHVSESSRRGSRKTTRNKLFDQYDCEELDTCYRRPENNFDSSDMSSDVLPVHKNHLEKLRRHRLRLCFSDLRDSMRFGSTDSSTSKMEILTRARIQIQFLHWERENLAQADDIVKRLNRNLQLYYLQLALSDDYERDKKSLEELKKSMQIDEDQKRLLEIERQHEIESLRLLRNKEAELKKLSLQLHPWGKCSFATPSLGKNIKDADYCCIDDSANSSSTSISSETEKIGATTEIDIEP